MAENTIRNYVNELRAAYHIPKVAEQRVYEAVPDSPMGLQVQMDFGQDLVTAYDGTKKTIFYRVCIIPF